MRHLLLLLLVILLATSCKSHKPYNPYLDLKTKPGEAMRKQDKKHIKKGNKAYKKQLGRNRKHLFGRKKAPGE